MQDCSRQKCQHPLLKIGTIVGRSYWFYSIYTIIFFPFLLCFIGWHCYWQCSLQRFPRAWGKTDCCSELGDSLHHKPGVYRWWRQSDRGKLLQENVAWLIGWAEGNRSLSVSCLSVCICVSCLSVCMSLLSICLYVLILICLPVSFSCLSCQACLFASFDKQ